MRLADQSRAALLSYAKAFSDRLELYRSRDSGRPIVVDLSHDYSSYIHTNVLVASYLGRFLGARELVGVIKTWPSVLERLDPDFTCEFARRFGFKEVVQLDGDSLYDADLREMMARFERGVMSATSTEEVADFVCQFEPELGIGSCVLDTTLRSLFSPRAPSRREIWLDFARECLVCLQNSRRVMREYSPAAFVTGHTQYTAYRMPAVAALENDAPVYYSHMPRMLHLERYSSLDELLNGRPAGLPGLFGEWRRTVRRRTPALEAFISNARQSILHARHELHAGFSAPTMKVGRRGRPQVVFYLHCLTDAAHAWGCYPVRDYGRWIALSLDAAAANPKVDYVVKPHPYDGLYDKSGFINELRGIYEGRPNITFLDGGVGDLPVGSFDVAVTVQGSVGYELPQSGVQTLALHGGRYRGLGCAVEPQSLDEYREFLGEPLRISKVSDEQRWCAELYGFAETLMMRSRSFFLPGLRREWEQSYWDQALSALMQHALEEDPAWRDIAAMVERNEAVLTNGPVAEALGLVSGREWPLSAAL